jgi:hypothetical protein
MTFRYYLVEGTINIHLERLQIRMRLQESMLILKMLQGRWRAGMFVELGVFLTSRSEVYTEPRDSSPIHNLAPSS